MEAMAVQLVETTPEEFAADLTRDAEKYDQLVRDLGIQLD